MEGYIHFLLIVFRILFCLGVVSAVIAAILAKRGKHPVLAVLLAIVSWVGIYSPLLYQISNRVAYIVAIIMGIYVAAILIWSVVSNKKVKKN